MLRITAASLLGLSSLLVTSDVAEACGRRCCRSVPVCCAAPACAAPAAAPAEPPPAYDAPAPPPAPETAQNGTRQTYRAFSAEPTAPMAPMPAPAPVYRAPMRAYQPAVSDQDRFRADHKSRGVY